MPEWAFGVTDWFEQGLYLPLYSISKNQGATFNGLKLRELFVMPNAAERTFFYGCNFEFSYNIYSRCENMSGRVAQAAVAPMRKVAVYFRVPARIPRARVVCRRTRVTATSSVRQR